MSHSQPLYHMLMRRLPLILVGFVASLVSAASGYAQQVVYYSPVVAQPTPYVARYTPSGTYSAVTAYSPPVAAAVPEFLILLDYQSGGGAADLMAFLKSHPAMKYTSAVKNEAYVALRYEELTPGPANIEAMAKMAEAMKEVF